GERRSPARTLSAIGSSRRSSVWKPWRGLLAVAVDITLDDTSDRHPAARPYRARIPLAPGCRRRENSTRFPDNRGPPFMNRTRCLALALVCSIAAHALAAQKPAVKPAAKPGRVRTYYIAADEV